MAIAFVASYLATTTTGAAAVTGAFTPTTGDFLVCKAVVEDSGTTLTTPTATVGGITWTLRVSDVTGSKTGSYLWTGVVTSGGSSITVSVARSGPAENWSHTVERWTGAELDATPALLDSQGSGAPSGTITTEFNSSYVTWCNGDWNANAPGTPAYRSSATAETYHDRSTSFYVGYYAYQVATTAGSQTCGMTSPTGQNWNMVGIELKASAGNITASPTAIASAEAFGTTAHTGTITLSATGIGTVEAFGTPAHTGAITLSPSAIASGEQIGSPTVIAGALTSTPTGIASSEAFGSATITGAISLSPTGISSVEVFGSPTQTNTLTSSPTGISSSEAFGTTAHVGMLISTPSGIASAEAFGTPTNVADGSFTAEPTGIASAEAFGTPVMSGTTVFSPSGITSEEAFGTLVAVLTLTAAPTGIASAEAFGVSVAVKTLTASPTGIASGETFGVPTVTLLFAVVYSPSGIGSQETFGNTTVFNGRYNLPYPKDSYSLDELRKAYYANTLGGTPDGTTTDLYGKFLTLITGISAKSTMDKEAPYYNSLSGLTVHSTNDKKAAVFSQYVNELYYLRNFFN